MNRWWKLGLAALVGAAVAIPATVLAGGGFDASGNADRFFTSSVGKSETNSANYKSVGLAIPTTTNAQAVTISAQMTKGKAKFRILSEEGPVASPGPVLFSSKGANAFTFGLPDACPRQALQWKRVGDERAKAAKISALAVNQNGPCL